METKKYFAKKGLTRNKAKEILKDGTAQGHKLTAKQKKYFGFVAGGGKPKAASGMINANAGQPQQAQPQGQPQGQPDQNPQPQGLSVIVTMVVNAPDGSQQPIGTVTIQKPDDLKQVIQKVIQVFQQGQQPQGGEQQPQGQPTEQQPAQPQQ